MSIDRYRPPAFVQREFGCPVEGCGSPYLTWHHFDPPWRQQPHHDPPGMVALCLQHHKEADAGAFLPEQLRAMKSEPYLRREGRPLAGSFHWRREQLVVRAGGLTAIGCQSLLRFGSVDAIWLSTGDDGTELLNLDVWNPDGTVLFSLRDNAWVALGPLEDVVCPPSARALILRVPSQGIRLSLEFSPMNEAGLRAYFRASGAQGAADINRHREEAARRAEEGGAPEFIVEAIRGEPEDPYAFAEARANELMEAARSVTSTSDFALCEIDARLVYPVEMVLTATQLILPGNNVIKGGTVIGGGVAVQIG